MTSFAVLLRGKLDVIDGGPFSSSTFKISLGQPFDVADLTIGRFTVCEASVYVATSEKSSIDLARFVLILRYQWR